MGGGVLARCRHGAGAGGPGAERGARQAALLQHQRCAAQLRHDGLPRRLSRGAQEQDQQRRQQLGRDHVGDHREHPRPDGVPGRACDPDRRGRHRGLHRQSGGRRRCCAGGCADRTSVPQPDRGTTSVALTVTLRNSGGAALTLSSFALTGTNATEFSLAIGSTCTAGGSAGWRASCTILVSFSPASSGSKSASPSITHLLQAARARCR
ncbi:MAG: hypothetical protein MZW92_44435 [Comamonadaceae bacterium]|nr:hypothetical protein [Comamonadaceae bacterium]